MDQFIEELQKEYNNPKLSLQEWKKCWLETCSTNELQIEWDVKEKGEKATATILQTPITEEHPTLRPHKIKVALFKADCSFDVVEVFVEATNKTSFEYNGSNAYVAMLPNYEDHTFVRINLDSQSLEFFSEHFTKIKDVLTRSMIWNSFYQAVKDAKITAHKHV